MMNKNKSSRYGLAAYALAIPLILLCMVFSYALAQDKPVSDTIKIFTDTKQKVEKAPDNALIILDGKVIDKAKMDAMNPKDFYAVNVLKGKEATDIYGKKGKNGVVLITSRKAGSEKKTIVTSYRYTDSVGMHKERKPAIIINGVRMSDDALKHFDPQSIQSIDVLKDDSLTKEFGEKGKEYVIKIKTKKLSALSYKDESKEISSVSELSDKDEPHAKKIINSLPDDALYILNGKVIREITKAEFNLIKTEDIENIKVLKGTATDAWGKKGEKGVLMVTTKKK